MESQFRLPGGDLEYAVLSKVWELGSASAREIHSQVGAPEGVALLVARATIRAVWSLIAAQRDQGTATVGLLRPRTRFLPHLAKWLDERQIEAALEHERAHARHRDPLRIWLAQLATDLQWPWPQAQGKVQARCYVALSLPVRIVCLTNVARG